MTAYAIILMIAYVPLWAIPYLHAIGAAGAGHAPVDFMSFWTAGRLAWIDPVAAYDPSQEAAFQDLAFQTHGSYLPFLYPPPFLGIVLLLATLPFAAAYLVWAWASWGLYAVAVRRLAPSFAWSLAAAPAAYVNAVQGQTGALFTAIFIAAAGQISSRPILSGALFGTLIFKPQLGLLIPVALAAGGYWRVFAGAVASSLALIAAALFAFGPSTFQAFFHASEAGASLLAGGALPWAKIQSMYGALRLLGAPGTVAALAQGATTLAGAVVVARTWRSQADIAAKTAMLACATLTATPYLLDYDFALLIVPIAWLGLRGAARGFAPWERSFLVLAYVMPALCRGMAIWSGVNLAPLVVLAVMILLIARSGPAPQAAAA